MEHLYWRMTEQALPIDATLRPLADRLRPTRLDTFFGQTHLLAVGKPLRRAIESGSVPSMVFWGPPGTGKTTLARLVSTHCQSQFLTMSAVLGGVKDIRACADAAQSHRAETGRGTVLFVDEVHRFNKSQQDAFLPFVEDGTLVFIGATTENPSFALNGALLSRARVFVLRALDQESIVAILQRAVADADDGLGALNLQVEQSVLETLAGASDGDARRALNALEILADLAVDGVIDEGLVGEVLAGGSTRRFDNQGDVFYDQISALHKSVRGSSPDASLYWLVRMLDGGCDPRYLARRVVRIASEDVGNADPRALRLALDAWEVQERLGSPEGELALAQAVLYLASCAKSNAVYKAYNAALDDIKSNASHEVPIHLRNAPTRLMKELGYARHYRYAHDEPEGYAAGEQYFPETMIARTYYVPTDRGLEGQIKEKLERLRAMDRKSGQKHR